jgi:serine/threonine protein kinase
MSTNLTGQVLLKQFRVDAFVASGGMGTVYKVWDLQRNVPLAMKVLHSDLAEDPSILKYFQREANALRKLTHPNIVPFYGFFHADELTFLLESYITGPTLKQILKGKPIPVLVMLSYLKALCAALGYAHSFGVVHCDVKPGNVMIDRGGNILLMDFGIARHAESTTTTLAGAGAPAYMAPEQIRGEAVTAATDIYALGVLLFEMLTGVRPFRGSESNTESGGTTASERIRYGHLHLPPPDPLSINPAIPMALAKVVLKCLAKHPEDRFQSTRELYKAACQSVGVVPEQVPDCVNPNPWVQVAPEDNTPIASMPVSQENKFISETKRKKVIISGYVLAGGVVLAGLLIIGLMVDLYNEGNNFSKPGTIGQITPIFYETARISRITPMEIIENPTKTIIPTHTPSTTRTPIPPSLTPSITSTKTSSMTPTITPTIHFIIDGRPNEWSWITPIAFRSEPMGKPEGSSFKSISMVQTADNVYFLFEFFDGKLLLESYIELYIDARPGVSTMHHSSADVGISAIPGRIFYGFSQNNYWEGSGFYMTKDKWIELMLPLASLKAEKGYKIRLLFANIWNPRVAQLYPGEGGDPFEISR